MSLFFPPILSLPAPQKPPANITQTLEKALTDAFIQALQHELGNSVAITAAENFSAMTLPAVFVKATRQRESITNSAIFQFEVAVALLVQADDSTAQDLESYFAQVLCVTHNIETLIPRINAIRPQRCFVFGILRDGGVSQSTSERHFERSVSLTVHAGLMG
jgi:hypothetical protein